MRNKNILICTVICFFMAIATVSIVNRNKNDEEFIDESKVRSIIIMNVLTGTAEEINNGNYEEMNDDEDTNVDNQEQPVIDPDNKNNNNRTDGGSYGNK